MISTGMEADQNELYPAVKQATLQMCMRPVCNQQLVQYGHLALSIPWEKCNESKLPIATLKASIEEEM